MARLSVKWATNGDQKAMWSFLIFAALVLCIGWDSSFWKPCFCGLSCSVSWADASKCQRGGRGLEIATSGTHLRLVDQSLHLSRPDFVAVQCLFHRECNRANRLRWLVLGRYRNKANFKRDSREIGVEEEQSLAFLLCSPFKYSEEKTVPCT